MSDEPILTISSEHVALGPLAHDQLPLLLRWLHEADFQRTTSHVRPLSLEVLEQYFERGTRAADELHFAIYELPKTRLIGALSLTQLTDRGATYAIGIGDPGSRGRGYGTEATRLVLRYGFDILGLHNIMLTVHADNERGLRAYKRAGFREMGRRREVLEKSGQLVDVVYMDCLAGENT